MAIPVPALSSKVDPEVKRAIAAIITQFNSVLDGSTSVGRASVAGEATVISGSGGATGVIYPVGSLTAIPSFNTILLSWTDNQSRDFIAGYEVFRAGVDDLALAVRIGYTSSKGYIDTPPDTSTAVEYYYWVRPVTRLDAPGPFNALAGTMAATANDPAYALEILAGQITESELYADLNTRIDQIDTPTTGLIDSLAAEITARGDADTIIASQIDSLSVGAGEQFDTNVIWHFNTGVESWSGNGTPTAASGFIKQADDGSDPYLTSPTGINSDATTYPRVRLRYRKTGAPVWEGKIWWQRTTDSTWDVARSVTVAEPTYDGDDIGEISTSMGWDGTIDQIRIDLISGQDASNYTEIDWAAIGRASPGASVASVTTEQTARINADTALALDITNLTATVGTNTADITTEQGVRASGDTALALAISNLTSEVDDNTAAISSEQTTRATADTALANSISSLSSTVSGNTAAISSEASTRASADTALAYSVSSLQTTVTGHTASISTHQTSIAGVEAQYTVKLDNNGFMSGFGLASTWAGDTAYSEFYAMADRFAFINPAVSPKVITSITRSGTTATATCTAHGITSGTYRVIAGAAQGQYNGVKLCTSTGANTFTFQVSGSPATPATVMEGLGSMNVSGSAASIPFIIDGGIVYINVAMFKDATIGSAKIAGLTADKILSGTLTAGQSITVAAGGSTAGSNYAQLTEGDLNFYDYYAGAHHFYKGVSRVVNGICTDGDIVNLGYFRQTPTVYMSPKALESYKQAYREQDQKFILDAINLRKSGDDWLFDAVCQLQLADNVIDGGSLSGGNAANVDTSPDPSNWGSAHYSSEKPISTPNVVGVAVTISLQTYGAREGSSPDEYGQYYTAYTKIKAALEIYHGGGWNTTSTYYESGLVLGYTNITGINLSASADTAITKARIIFYNVRWNNGWYIRPPSTFGNNGAVSTTALTLTLEEAAVSLDGTANYTAIG